jgi:CelD/BcsL family acetyltransferase involved in cellulose biosynthesis
MTRRPGDRTPEPMGGRAAERLRMFEEARRPPASSQDQTRKPPGRATKPRSSKMRRKTSAKQDRRQT